MAVRDTLRPFRWPELTIDLVEWTSGSGDSYNYGTRCTVTAPDGSVLVAFRGDEPARCGNWDMQELHRAAVLKSR